jgi:RanBP1 domain
MPPLAQEEDVKTGEEGEATVFRGDGVLFEFCDDEKTWKERGRGEMRVNVPHEGPARMVMRQRGNLRLLLNAALWPEMPVNVMDGGKVKPLLGTPRLAVGNGRQANWTATCTPVMHVQRRAQVRAAGFAMHCFPRV